MTALSTLINHLLLLILAHSFFNGWVFSIWFQSIIFISHGNINRTISYNLNMIILNLHLRTNIWLIIRISIRQFLCSIPSLWIIILLIEMIFFLWRLATWRLTFNLLFVMDLLMIIMIMLLNIFLRSTTLFILMIILLSFLLDIRLLLPID